MSGIPDKKQSITAALTQRRIQLQNEGSLLKRKLDMKNTSWSRSKVIRANGLAAPPFSDGFYLVYPRVKRGFIFTAQVKSRSNVVTVDHSASFGEKSGNSPSP